MKTWLQLSYYMCLFCFTWVFIIDSLLCQLLFKRYLRCSRWSKYSLPIDHEILTADRFIDNEPKKGSLDILIQSTKNTVISAELSWLHLGCNGRRRSHIWLVGSTKKMTNNIFQSKKTPKAFLTPRKKGKLEDWVSSLSK